MLKRVSEASGQVPGDGIVLAKRYRVSDAALQVLGDAVDPNLASAQPNGGSPAKHFER